jgi:hypothetical protein
MRITTKIASAGDTYLGRFPVLPCSIDELKDEAGGIDHGKMLSALKDYREHITWSSGDDRGVVALAVEFIRQMESVTKKLAADETSDARVECQKSVDYSLERKMDRGRFGYVRFDFDRHGGHLRVRIGISNPKGVVGTVELSCRRFAVYAARVLRYMARELKPEVVVELVGTGDAADVFAEAEYTERKQAAGDEVDAANEKRKTCVRRLGEYCSPSDPNCRCYCNGRCVEAKLGAEREESGR